MFKFIITTFIFTFSLGFQTPAMASHGDAGLALSTTEVELKINLNKSGFDKLKVVFLQKYKGEESGRLDIYFDMFLNGAYQLKTSPSPIKLRFQSNGKELTWQTQKTIGSSTAFIFSVKKTDAISMDVPFDNGMITAIKNYHTQLDALDPYALTIASQIQGMLSDKGIFHFTKELCPQCTQEDSFYSTHINTKSRVKIKLKLPEAQFSIQVGETNNRGILSYELEAEIKKGNDVQKSAEALLKWLKENGFDETTHIDPAVAIDPTQNSALKLKQLL